MCTGRDIPCASVRMGEYPRPGMLSPLSMLATPAQASSPRRSIFSSCIMLTIMCQRAMIIAFIRGEAS